MNLKAMYSSPVCPVQAQHKNTRNVVQNKKLALMQELREKTTEVLQEFIAEHDNDFSDIAKELMVEKYNYTNTILRDLIVYYPQYQD